MKKIDEFINLFGKNKDVFQCPKCGSGFSIENASLLCENGHNFDISRKGYVNLFGGSKSIYDRELFDERSRVFEAGFFNPLLIKISEIMKEASGVLVDAGSGEGFALDFICKKINRTGVGLDLAKEGINLATRFNQLWFISDIASIPLKDNSAGGIINILSPANYSEFKRVIATSGIILKVFPGNQYLTEIRNHFYKETDKESYSNEATLRIFKEAFSIYHEEDLCYEFKTQDKSILNSIIHMTPLAKSHNLNQWDFSPEYITADFKILWTVSDK